jgi:lysophospholipase L1-like esterase
MVDLSKMIQGWKNTTDTSIRIVAFGSSNTELFWHSAGRHNWVDWLNINIREHIGRHVLVINQGICGDTTEDLLNRLERDVLSLSPRIAIVTIGGNDSSRSFSYDYFYGNLKEICRCISDKGILPVLQTYYCPLYEDYPETFRPVFESFAAANRKLAAELDIPLVDNYSFFEPLYSADRTLYRRLMRDGLHVNYIGNYIMGTIASRAFGLPDPQVPEDTGDEIRYVFKKMTGNFIGPGTMHE